MVLLAKAAGMDLAKVNRHPYKEEEAPDSSGLLELKKELQCTQDLDKNKESLSL